MEKKRAWWSDKQAKMGPTNFYELEDGGEVEITEVKSDLSKPHGMPDAVDLGVVVKWLRVGKPDPNPKKPISFR